MPPLVEIPAVGVDDVVAAKGIGAGGEGERILVGTTNDDGCAALVALTTHAARKLRRVLALALTEPPPRTESGRILQWQPRSNSVGPR